MMHAQLASDVTVTHALFCQRQSLNFSRLIGFLDTWLRGEVQLTRTAAKALTLRSIFPAFENLRRLLTLRARRKNTAPRASHRRALLHFLPHTADEILLSREISCSRLCSLQLRSFLGAAHAPQQGNQTFAGVDG
jgi:hypothetical protein